MLFNSLGFAVFLPLVFAGYWLLSKKDLRLQNFLLLAASYFFYACWDWRFLFLLMFSTALDFITGIRMHQAASQRSRKAWFWASIAINLGFLCVFKYYNFFAESMAELLRGFGVSANISSLQVILPVGISFYTFHGLSYVIDIYKKRIEPERDPVTYSLFVSYFPLLVAGPIERATHLLPQIKRRRTFDFEKARDGIFQILWGIFKKVVIADSCARYANAIFDSPDSVNSGTLILGAVYFAFQIYGDFSGYSDIALGTSRLFGIDLLRNFAYPYFSRDIAEFWRRWHISLSTWFRDYLYIPLGGSKGGIWMKVRNTFIIFLVSGFWHGANWTFIVWGALNALYFMPLLLTGRNRANIDTVAHGSWFPSFRDLWAMASTFALTTLAWIFFRADSVQAAWHYIAGIFKMDFAGIDYLSCDRNAPELLPLLALFVIAEWFSREHEHPVFGNFRTARALAILAGIVLLGSFSDLNQFIYFQF